MLLILIVRFTVFKIIYHVFDMLSSLCHRPNNFYLSQYVSVLQEKSATIVRWYSALRNLWASGERLAPTALVFRLQGTFAPSALTLALHARSWVYDPSFFGLDIGATRQSLAEEKLAFVIQSLLQNRVFDKDYTFR